MNFNKFSSLISLIFRIIIVLFIINECYFKPPILKEIPKVVVEKENFFAFLYITDQFSEEQQDVIAASAFEWNQQTRSVVTFKVVNFPFDEVDFNQGILVINVDKYDPDVIFNDSLNLQAFTIGVTNMDSAVPNIKLVMSRIENNDVLRTAVLHELGHAIGLKHNFNIKDINTLMFPVNFSNIKNITKTDLKNVCVIYSCDAFTRYVLF